MNKIKQWFDFICISGKSSNQNVQCTVLYIVTPEVTVVTNSNYALKCMKLVSSLYSRTFYQQWCIHLYSVNAPVYCLLMNVQFICLLIIKLYFQGFKSTSWVFGGHGTTVNCFRVSIQILPRASRGPPLGTFLCKQMFIFIVLQEICTLCL